MIDQFGRDLRYLRIALTDRCNYRCRYCMPEEGIQQLDHSELLTLEELYHVVHLFVTLGVTKLRLTGGEPLVRSGMLNFLASVSQLKPLEDIALTTNGAYLKSMAVELKRHGLHRVNISLDTLREDRFRYITQTGHLTDVLESIEEAKRVGLKIKINTVINKGINDDEIADFIQLTKDWGVDVRFIELMPIGDNVEYATKHFYSNETILKNFPELTAIASDDPSSPARYFQYQDAPGKVGLISPLTCNFCSQCNRLRLTPEGLLKPCLHSDIEIDLRTPLREGKDLIPYIMEAVRVKPERHLLEQHKTIIRNMSQIGG